MELEEFVKSVLAQIGKGIAAYRRDGGVAVLFPDTVTFEVHLRGTRLATVVIPNSQPDARLLFTIQTADPEFKAPPFPRGQRTMTDPRVDYCDGRCVRCLIWV